MIKKGFDSYKEKNPFLIDQIAIAASITSHDKKEKEKCIPMTFKVFLDLLIKERKAFKMDMTANPVEVKLYISSASRSN